MKILAISTSTNNISVCVTENEKRLCELTADVNKKHSVMLLPVIDRLLDLIEIKIEDIDLFACDIGPGSFTGIRIGVSTINAFMISTGKMIAGISSLDIIAANINTYSDITVCIIYARNDQIYGAVYSGEEIQGGYFAGSVDDFLDRCPCPENETVVFTGDGSTFFKEKIRNRYGNDVSFSTEKDNVISAYILAVAAYKKGGSNEYIKPLYLKRSSAEAMEIGK